MSYSFRSGLGLALAIISLGSLSVGPVMEPRLESLEGPKVRKGRHDRRNGGSKPVPGGGAKERARRLARMPATAAPERPHGSPVCIWKEPSGWYWDDAEDRGVASLHCLPTGPFLSPEQAEADALDCFTVSRFERRRPDHYPTARTT